MVKNGGRRVAFKGEKVEPSILFSVCILYFQLYSLFLEIICKFCVWLGQVLTIKLFGDFSKF